MLFTVITAGTVSLQTPDIKLQEFGEPGKSTDRVIPVFKNTLLSGSVNANFLYLVEISLVDVNNSTSVLLFRNNTVGTLEIRILAEVGGYLSLHFLTINTTGVESPLADLSLQTSNDLLRTFNPLVAPLLVLGAVTLYFENRRDALISRANYYGSVPLNYNEILFPSLIALVSFSFTVPDITLRMIETILTDMTTGYYYYLYWLFITLTGGAYFTRRSKDVRYLWSSYRGREQTAIFRTLYASRSLLSVLVQSIIYYFLIFYFLVLGYLPEQEEVFQTVLLCAVITLNAVTHLSFLGVLMTILNERAREVFLIGQILVDNLSSAPVFTTYIHSTSMYFISSGIGALIVLLSAIILPPVVLLNYKLYINSEVYT